MGSPPSEPGRSSDEGPQHEITISHGFWLGRYEITQGQWEAVTDSIPWIDSTQVREEPAHPAVYISWDDVQELIGRLNKDAGQVLSEVDPLATASRSGHVLRGGSYSSVARNSRSAFRHLDSPEYRSGSFGARLLLAAPAPTAVSPQSWGQVKLRRQDLTD